MPTPLCRCRTLYIGSAVPTVTKDGLQGIQEPLRERYPVDQNEDTKGIDSWLSVWSNGLLLEYNEGSKKTQAAFFPIETLHYCAAVRYVNVSGYSVEGGGERFLPLDSPFANLPDSEEPPIFAAILRRTSGVRVLECHAFICTNTKAANALVRSCFVAYADTSRLRMDNGLPEEDIPGRKAIKDKDSEGSSSPSEEIQENGYSPGGEESQSDREIVAESKPNWERRQQAGDYETASISSSLAGRYRKRDKVSNNGTVGVPKKANSKAQSEIGGTIGSRGGTLVPAGRGQQQQQQFRRRRANSEMDLLMASGATLPRGGGPMPPPGMMGGPPPPGHPMMGPPMMGPPMGPPGMGPPGMGMPPHMGHHPMGPGGPPPPMGMGGPPGPPMGHPMGPGGPPPPFMMGPGGPPPPPHMMGPPHPGMMGPHPPPEMMMGPPPHMMPPPGMMPPPHPGMFQDGPMPPPHLTSPPPPDPYMYGTMRRGTLPARRSYEEPVYMPGSSNGMMQEGGPYMMPPESSYRPSSIAPDQYDAYFGMQGSTARSKKGRTKRREERGSMLSGRGGQDDESEQGKDMDFGWDANVYEGGIYRKQPYLNEKAFGTTIRRDQPETGNGIAGDRPPTPPVDYEVPRLPNHNGSSRRIHEDFNRISLADDQRLY